MAFRKRKVAVSRDPLGGETSKDAAKDITVSIRPSSLTSRPVTSTGTPSLDSLLGGHGGLALGSSLLVEESGTTDFSGALMRYYATQGICHGHAVHVSGVGEAWVRELPGVAVKKSGTTNERSSQGDDAMKIAWRYGKSSPVGERALPDRDVPRNVSSPSAESPFCHTFDLSKRLEIPQDAKLHHISVVPSPEPFNRIIDHLEQSLRTSSTNVVHRLVVPTILSPALYPPQANRPENFIRFLHSLRSLLRRYSEILTAMISLPLELYPRNTGLVRWAEILCDGVLELTPFPHRTDASSIISESEGAKGVDDQPQGMVKVHKLPINTERGDGGAGAGNSLGEDQSFTVSRRKFTIKPFSLPPLEGDQDVQKEAGKLTGKDVEF